MWFLFETGLAWEGVVVQPDLLGHVSPDSVYTSLMIIIPPTLSCCDDDDNSNGHSDDNDNNDGAKCMLTC